MAIGHPPAHHPPHDADVNLTINRSKEISYAEILQGNSSSFNYKKSQVTKTNSFKPFTVNFTSTSNGSVQAHPNFVFGDFNFKISSSFKPTMEYCGKKAVLFQKSDKARLINKIQHVLIGKFSHGRPSISAIKDFFYFLKLKGSCNISLFDSKHLYIECDLYEDYIKIWLEKVWNVKGFQMRVFKWSEEFNPRQESPIAPVWVHLYGLPLYLFEKKALLSIANAIGNPLLISRDNLNRSNLSCAKMCVELDVTKTLLDEVWIEFGKDLRGTIDYHDEKRDGFWQKLEYGPIPYYCTACSHIDHTVEFCKQRKESDPKKASVPGHNRAYEHGSSSDISVLQEAQELGDAKPNQTAGGVSAADGNAQLGCTGQVCEGHVCTADGFLLGTNCSKNLEQQDHIKDFEEGEIRDFETELKLTESVEDERKWAVVGGSVEGSGQPTMQLEVNSVSQKMLHDNLNTVHAAENRTLQDLLGTKCNQAGGTLCVTEGLILDKKCSRDTASSKVGVWQGATDRRGDLLGTKCNQAGGKLCVTEGLILDKKCTRDMASSKAGVWHGATDRRRDLLGTKCNQAGGNLCVDEGLILDKKCNRDIASSKAGVWQGATDRRGFGQTDVGTGQVLLKAGTLQRNKATREKESTSEGDVGVKQVASKTNDVINSNPFVQTAELGTRTDPPKSVSEGVIITLDFAPPSWTEFAGKEEKVEDNVTEQVKASAPAGNTTKGKTESWADMAEKEANVEQKKQDLAKEKEKKQEEILDSSHLQISAGKQTAADPKGEEAVQQVYERIRRMVLDSKRHKEESSTPIIRKNIKDYFMASSENINSALERKKNNSGIATTPGSEGGNRENK